MTFGLGTSVGPHLVGNTNTDGTARGPYGGSRMFFNSGGFSFDYSSTTSGARSWTTYADINSDGVFSIRRGGSSNDNIRFYNTDGNYSYIRTTAASNTNNTWFDAPLGATIWLGWDNPGGARTSATYSQVYIGTGRGTINETVLLRRGDIEGKDGAGTVNYRIVATGALGSHTFFNYGNVGVGTNAPTNKLQIGSVGSTGYGGNDLVIGNGSQVMAFYQSSTISTWYTNTSFSLMPSGTGSVGNLGLGTLTPSNLLTVGSTLHTSPSETNRILNWYSVGSEIHNPNIPLVIGNNNTSTSQPQMVGISLFNRSTTNNTWTPALTFGGLSTSGNYMGAAAGIAAQLPANTSDNNFRGGNLVFYVSGLVTGERGLIERVRINSSGNMGINTNDPTLGKLQITGDNNQLGIHTTGTYSSIYFYNGSTDRAGIYVTSTETHFEGRGSSGLYFGGATSQNHVRITSGGDVGIGTPSPEQRLHVAGGISQFVFSTNSIPCTVRIHNDNNDQEAGIRIRSKSSGGNNMHADIAVKGTGSDDVGYLGFKVPFNNTPGGGYKMAILSTGNVGIGTTSPSYTLDVAGQIGMHDEAQDIDSRFYGGTFLRGWQSFSAGNESSITYTTDTTCPIGVEVISVNTYVWARGPKIRLDKTQNYEVEIWIKRHTSNTGGTFYFVVSNYDSSGNIISGDGTDWHYPTNVTPPSGTWTKYTYIVGPYGGSKDHSSSARYISVGFIANYTGGNDVIYLSGFKCRPIPRYSNDALTVYNSGSIGIKKTNPSYALDVTGDIRATSDIIAYSDISVKENIRLIENPLARINKIRGVKFDRIDTMEKDNIGFIAQEIEGEFPELVSTDEEGKKAVKYQNTVAVLVEAIKELNQKVEDQQKIINDLLRR